MDASRKAKAAEVEAKAKQEAGKTATIVETIPAKKKRKDVSTGAGRGANQKRGRKVGSNTDLAQQFGISDQTVRRADKRAKAIGIPMLQRISQHKQFDKPGAVDALAKMDEQSRESIVAKAESGEVVDLKPKAQPSITSLDSCLAAIESMVGDLRST